MAGYRSQCYSTALAAEGSDATVERTPSSPLCGSSYSDRRARSRVVGGRNPNKYQSGLMDRSDTKASMVCTSIHYAKHGRQEKGSDRPEVRESVPDERISKVRHAALTVGSAATWGLYAQYGFKQRLSSRSDCATSQKVSRVPNWRQDFLRSRSASVTDWRGLESASRLAGVGPESEFEKINKEQFKLARRQKYKRKKQAALECASEYDSLRKQSPYRSESQSQNLTSQKAEKVSTSSLESEPEML